jgi:hypothetical protein
MKYTHRSDSILGGSGVCSGYHCSHPSVVSVELGEWGKGYRGGEVKDVFLSCIVVCVRVWVWVWGMGAVGAVYMCCLCYGAINAVVLSCAFLASPSRSIHT